MKRLVETALWDKQPVDTQVTEQKPVATNQNSQTFFKLDDPALQVALPKVYKALYLIDTYSPLGKRVLEWNRTQTHVTIDETHTDNYSGLYRHSIKRITLGAQNSVEENVNTIAHELMRHVQHVRQDLQA